MRKTIYPLLWVVMSLAAYPSYGQLATWALITDGSGASTNPNITAEDLTAGIGISALQYDPVDGVRARGWTTDAARNEMDYLEFCVSAETGTPSFSGVSFEVWQNGAGPTSFDLRYSLDGFQTSEPLHTADVSDMDYSPVVSVSFMNNIDVCGSTQLCFRIYAYNAVSTSGFFGLRPNTLEVNGSFPNLCTPPSEQAVITAFSNVTTNSMVVELSPGNGFSRLIAVKADSPVTARPCDGVNYSGNQTFGGSGDYLADGSYVLRTAQFPSGTTLQVLGLSEGITYHFAVFEANNTGCYNPDPGVNFQTTDCTSPTDVSNVTTSIADGQVSLQWTVPMCNEIMIVAGTASVTGTPQGTGGNYDPDSQYGAGLDLNVPPDFTAPEYIVFKDMNALDATVTGLTNGVTYYFKIFSRLGEQWSPGVEVTATPTGGCVELGGYEMVYINEINHYEQNSDGAHGVEIIGPAGTDLAGYQLILYHPNGTIEHTELLSGVIPNLNNSGYGVLWFPIPEIEAGNGSVAFYNSNTGIIIEFLSYRGNVITALEGPAEGMTSVGIGGSANRPGTSMQLVDGTGNCPSDFSWQNRDSTPGTLNESQSVLPVELTYFRGRAREDYVRLEWQTATELNNDYFSVERSADGRSFREIDRVDGAGNSQVTLSYLFDDREPLPGISYYRLRQVDYDGQFEYSPVIAVAFRSDENLIQLYPTVTSGAMQLRLAQPLRERSQLVVYTLSGQMVLSRELPVDFQDETLDVSGLASGAYLLQLRNSREVFNRRFVRK